LKMREKPLGRKVFLLAVFLLGVSFFHPDHLSAAPENPWQITADSLIHLQMPEGILAEGNVILSRAGNAPGTMVLRADWVRYDVERGLIKARGHVYIITGQDEILAESASMELEGETGIFTEATVFLAEDHLYIIGSEIEKTGEITYIIHDGWVSACDPYNPEKTPPWAIRSSRTDIKVDGMAIMKHARFQVKEVPFLYTPWMTFPVKTKRETGFLFPEWSHSSRNGVGFVLPFFVNLSPSADITLYPNYLQQRGMIYGVEGRYVAAEKSYGTFIFDYLRDRRIDTLEDNYKSDGFVRTDRNRYWFRGKADHGFSDSLVGRLDLDFVSDRDFIQEFRNEGNGFVNNDRMFVKYFARGLGEETSSSRSSTAQLVKSWQDMTLSGEAQIVQDVSDAVSSITPVQTLPRLNFDGRTPIDDSLWSISWSSEYANFWRKGGIGGQKLDVHPQFITSVPRGTLLEGSMTTGFRESLYYVEVYGHDTGWEHDNRLQNRFVPDFNLSLATLFMRDFDLAVQEYQWLEHLVRPNVSYSYAPRVDESHLPPFADTVAAANSVTYSLNNYFELGGTDEDGNYLSRNLGLFNVSQSYNILEDRRAIYDPADKQRVFSDVSFDLMAYPLENLNLRYQTAWSVYGRGITSYQLLTQYGNRRGDSFSVDYRYTLNGAHEVTGEAQLRATDFLTVRGSMTNDLETDHTVRSLFGLVYSPPCWKMELRATREIQEQTLMIVFYLDAIGKGFGWDKDNL